LSIDIGKVLDDHRGRYGAPRIYRVMCEQSDCAGSFDRIQALMRGMGLRAKTGRKYKVTTDSAHALPIAAGLPGQNFSCDPGPAATSRAKAPDQVRLSAITHL
jgi:putative transposase